MDLIKEENHLKQWKLEILRKSLQQEMRPLVSEEWYKLLKNEFGKEYFLKLGLIIRKDRKTNIIYPSTFKDVFSVFKNTNPFKIKVIIVGQDPYPDGSYDGRAFSNSLNKRRLSPSLVNILKEVEDDIYNGLNLDMNPDLKRWEKQGVFLINRVLTVRRGAPNSHSNIGWEIFTKEVIGILANMEQPKVFMLWGNAAKTLSSIIPTKNNLILESHHPSPLSANRGGWFGNKHFSKANSFLEKNNLKKIIW